MTTDRLVLAHALEEAGIEREGAEKVASIIFDAIHDNVATKTDLALLRAQLTHDLTMRGIYGLSVAVGTLFALLRIWPGH